MLLVGDGFIVRCGSIMSLNIVNVIDITFLVGVINNESNCWVNSIVVKSKKGVFD